MRRVYLTIWLAVACCFLSHQGCDKGIACEPPKITNLQDGDTLVADHCNKLSFQFEADPGVVCGDEQITGWDVISGVGGIDNQGLYSFYREDVGVYLESVEVTNDCSPPLTDEISFYVAAETVASQIKDRDRYEGLDWPLEQYIFGPPEAESLKVKFETNGSTTELEALGISFRQAIPGIKNNRYSARISIEQWKVVRKLPTLLWISAMGRIKAPLP